jgi:hypothetical protein
MLPILSGVHTAIEDADMATLLEEVESKVEQLSVNDRAQLLDMLIARSDESPLGDVESAWIDEAEARYDAYLAGRRPGVSATSVFQDAAALLNES